MDKHEKIMALAEKFGAALTWKYRDDGKRYVILDKDSPHYSEWMHDAVYAAHDGKLPNDWTYEMVEEAVDWIKADGENAESCLFAEAYISPHSHAELLAWASSHGERWDLAEEKLEEGENALAAVFFSAMFEEALDVFNIVYNHLASEAELALEED